MKKLITTLLIIGVFPILCVKATDVYFTDKGYVSFFSSAPLEDIKAENYRVSAMLNIKDGRMVFRVPIRAFEFDKSLMRTHFNEDFMESDKYPRGEFTGKVLNINDIDFSKNGKHEVEVEGELTIKGITQALKTKGTLEVKDGKIIGESSFFVKLEDHDIERPSILLRNIAEEVEVTIKIEYEPYQRRE